MPADGRAAAARRTVALPAAEVFAFLADLRNHWRLAGRWIEVVELHPPAGPADGATVRLRGPLGVRRTVRTAVDEAHAPHVMAGHALAGAARAEVRWRLAESAGGTDVRVEVRLATGSALDRALWRLGGRRWLAWRLARTVRSLEALVPAAAEPRAA